MTALPKPTAAELEILEVLWTRGSATVRQVQEDVSVKRDASYTTMLKLMQIMHEKGLVRRDERDKAHVYRAVVSREKTRRRLVGDLVEKMFRGSALSLVQHVLETTPATAEELAEIRRLIAEAEKEARK